MLMVIDVTTSGLCEGVGKVPKYWEARVGDCNWDMDFWYLTLEEDEAWRGRLYARFSI